MNYVATKVVLSTDVIQLTLFADEQPLTFRQVFRLWQYDTDFIHFYIDTLKSCDFPALYWEHPALQSSFLDMPYECIVQQSQTLERLKVNENAFGKYIYTSSLVVDFSNLGRDARLVVPTKQTEKEIYNHLGRFIQSADKAQLIAVFNRVGKVVLEELENKKVIWVNTAGLGVIWLHIRLDTRPKYYKTIAYKDTTYLVKKTN